VFAVATQGVGTIDVGVTESRDTLYLFYMREIWLECKRGLALGHIFCVVYTGLIVGLPSNLPMLFFQCKLMIINNSFLLAL